MSHRLGKPPGASPTETIYWHEDVLISLSLIVDGKAITNAVTWGIKQTQRTHFQIVVLSLFEVAFAEVSLGGNGGGDDNNNEREPFIRVSAPLSLSPLREEYCVSTHPRKRPERKPGIKVKEEHGELAIGSHNCTGSAQRLQYWFPGLPSLVHFFDAAASRRAASRHEGRLLLEIYHLILDAVNHETWKTWLIVSRGFRAYCLRKYRLDDRIRLVAGPFVRLRQGYRKDRMLSFDFENIQTGASFPAMRATGSGIFRTAEYSWMPVIGSDRKVLMLDVLAQYKSAGDVPVEADGDDLAEDVPVKVDGDDE